MSAPIHTVRFTAQADGACGYPIDFPPVRIGAAQVAMEAHNRTPTAERRARGARASTDPLVNVWSAIRNGCVVLEVQDLSDSAPRGVWHAQTSEAP